MKLFDTHAHIGLINIDQLEQLMAIQYAKRAGVAHIVSICNSLADFDQTYKNLSSAKQVFHAVGLSPTEQGIPAEDGKNASLNMENLTE